VPTADTSSNSFLFSSNRAPFRHERNPRRLHPGRGDRAIFPVICRIVAVAKRFYRRNPHLRWRSMFCGVAASPSSLFIVAESLVACVYSIPFPDWVLISSSIGWNHKQMIQTEWWRGVLIFLVVLAGWVVEMERCVGDVCFVQSIQHFLEANVGGHALISFLPLAVRCASCIIKCSELPLLFVPHYGWLGVKYWSWLRQPTI